MGYNITSEDIHMLTQKEKNYNIYIDILNRNFKTVDQIQGIVIGDSYSINAESEIRSTYQVTLHASNNYISMGEEKQIWIDKYFKVSFGVKNTKTKNIHKYPFGVFVLNDDSFGIDSSNSNLTLSLADMVCMLDGTLSGELGTDMLIEEGSNIRSVMISILTQKANINKYRIENMNKLTPYDLEFSASDTIWSVITELRELYAGWETFFDVDGTFVCQPIPTGHNESVILNDNILKPLLISENINNDILKIRNITKIFGQCLSSDYYTENVSFSNNTYTLNIPTMTTSPSTGTRIAFKVPTTNTGDVSVKINSFSIITVCDDNQNSLSPKTLQAGKSYVFRYRSGKFYFQGEWQIVGIVKEVKFQPTESEITADKAYEGIDNIKYIVNFDSPFSIEKIGERRQVLSGGNYENIYSQQLVLERAEYENWLCTRMTSKLVIEVIQIPFLTVNTLVEFTRSDTNEKDKYIVKQISGSSSDGKQTISMVKYYPLYPFIVEA